MSRLFSPLHIKDVELKNRIVVSPMCQYSSVDGYSNDWHLVHLGSRAVGGAGLLIQEASAVSPEGRITPDDLGIYLDGHIEGLKRITRFIHSQGAVAGIQLAHAGRKASHTSPWKGGIQLAGSDPGWKTVSASAVSFTETEEPPLELDTRGIRKVLDDFGAATARALEAGYRVAEIHAAHGYLIHQFLSPLSNKRTDEYGGSFENRVRLLLQVVEAVKQAWRPDYPLFVRLSCTDWMEGGWNIEESVKVSALLKDRGIDLIDCSSGGVSPKASIPLGPAYQAPFAARIKKDTGILTGAVGLITGPEQSEEILDRGEADLIIMAREFLRNPYFPLQAARILGDGIPWPPQYERAKNK
ncbi:MAG: NADH:flavin oxidoreductase/NADH oxidase [Puia sp.]|nr:NADH:flavin oxidoreductase/NADH oxidase [Puia sp.]